MPDYRRNFVPGGTYFFTVALLERKRDLLVAEIELLRDAVRRVKRLYPFDIVAWVVLPDHLHCIWTLPDGDSDYPTRWRLIKLLFAKGLPKVERRSAIRKKRGERGIWHRRYWEHTIRDERDLNNHIDYVHWNPVKHGLVSAVKDWPYSTFHRYVHAGILPSNWMAANIELDVVVGEVE
jgi:putative transposase